MELQHFAQQVLFSESLEKKLSCPPSFEKDSSSEHILWPDKPVRSKELQFRGRPKHSFPKSHHISCAQKRAQIFHFFANHELLALELMALALLKFKDAPLAFRMGIAHTMNDEIKHLRLYEARMHELGLAFGDLPVNDFFWRALKGMETPLDYVASMSMTFEQANLDYASYYRSEFAAIGDDRSVETMDVVYQDEISHVAHGVKWFDQWRAEGQESFDFYRSLLRAPMTPRRARGIGFDRSAREKAGLTADYIDSLEVYSHSRGRPGRLYWFNGFCEKAISKGSRGYKPNAGVQEFIADQSSLMMFLGCEEDFVLSRQDPSPAYLREVMKLGYPLPGFVKEADLKRVLVSEFQPWGWSPDSRHLQSQYALSDGDWAGAPINGDPQKRLYDKSWHRSLRQKIAFETGETLQDFSVEHFADAEEKVFYLQQMYGLPVVIKGLFGSSGQNRKKISGTFGSNEEQWLKKRLQQDGAVVIEPWLERVMDLSLQLDLSKGCEKAFLGCTRFFVSKQGQYLGHFFGDLRSGLGRDMCKAVDTRALASLALAVAGELWQMGYRGQAGVDCFYYRSPIDRQVRLRPLVEINPRYTMGRVALSLQRRLRGRGVWIFLGKKEMATLGYGGFIEFSEAMKRSYPIVQKRGFVVDGVFFTNDPSQCQSAVGMVAMGHAFDQLRDLRLLPNPAN